MGRDGLSVVEKMTSILNRFVDQRAPSLGFNQIVDGTGMSRASAHRVLAEMTEHGLLAQDASRDAYRLGSLLLRISGLAQRQGSLVERSRARMEALRDQFGETIVLAELHGDRVVPVQRVDGLYEMRMNQELGRAYPAYAGATGKTMLAHLDPELLSHYLANTQLEPLTATTVRSAERLRLDLERIRRTGVAVSRGERVAAAIAVAAPVFDERGHLAAAITVSGLASRFDVERLSLAARAVKAAADALSAEMGFVAPEGAPAVDALSDPKDDRYELLHEMCRVAWFSEEHKALIVDQ